MPRGGYLEGQSIITILRGWSAKAKAKVKSWFTR